MKRTKEKNTIADCVMCSSRTSHKVVYTTDRHYDIEEIGEQYWYTYSVLTCEVCQAVCFREQYTTTEDYDGSDNGRLPLHTVFYPVSDKGRRPADFCSFLPVPVDKMYGETLKAFNNGIITLAAVGMRALVEAICLDKKCGGKNLQEKIDNLVKTGELALKQARFLHEQRFLGNEAAHELVSPTRKELEESLNVLESLMLTIYVLPVTTARLSKTRAARKPKVRRVTAGR